ncbi:MAG: flavodoxin family protein, partial [Ignavibacteriales bacterium]
MKAIILLGTLKKNSLSNTEVLSDFKKKNIASSIIKKTT